MQEAIAAINDGTGGSARLGVRIGINTGDVVAGDPSVGATLVTGDAVNTAARLEQAAESGTILVGAMTRHLVRDAVEMDQPVPLALKGKAEPVPAYRVVRLIGDEGPRRAFEPCSPHASTAFHLTSA